MVTEGRENLRANLRWLDALCPGTAENQYNRLLNYLFK